MDPLYLVLLNLFSDCLSTSFSVVFSAKKLSSAKFVRANKRGKKRNAASKCWNKNVLKTWCKAPKILCILLLNTPSALKNRTPPRDWVGYPICWDWAGYPICWDWAGYPICWDWTGYPICWDWGGGVPPRLVWIWGGYPLGLCEFERGTPPNEGGTPQGN